MLVSRMSQAASFASVRLPRDLQTCTHAQLQGTAGKVTQPQEDGISKPYRGGLQILWGSCGHSARECHVRVAAPVTGVLTLEPAWKELEKSKWMFEIRGNSFQIIQGDRKSMWPED